MTTAAGQVRAHCLLHGVSPPSLGSFEFYVFSEGLRRDKLEKLSFAKLVINIAVSSGFITQEKGNLFLYEYGEDLHQFRYNYGYVPISKRLAAVKVQKKNEDFALLQKVAAMTVKD